MANDDDDDDNLSIYPVPESFALRSSIDGSRVQGDIASVPGTSQDWPDY
jgi:hypothetical protein